MADQTDYPAAHSMDTVWWGLDRDGHVARVETGEAGAAPAVEDPEAFSSNDGESLDLVALASAAKALFTCDDLFPIADKKIFVRPSPWGPRAGEIIEVTAEEDHDMASFLLWLRDEAALETVRAHPRGASALLLRSPGRVVVWLEYDYNVDEGSQSLLKTVLGFQGAGLINRGWLYEFGSLEPERFGIFSYHLHHFDNWIAGPFTHSATPAAPLHIHQIPKELRAQIHVLPDVDFVRDALLQPYEHGEAYSWEERWVSTTGHVLETEGDDDLEDDLPMDADTDSLRPNTTVSALLAAYLNGEPDSVEVLGDWCAEQNRSRLHAAETAAGRLDEVLHAWFTPVARLALEAKFVAHALTQHPVSEPAEAAVRAVLDAVQRQIEGHDDETSRMEATNTAFGAWMPDLDDGDEDEDEQRDEPCRLTWAAWALGYGYPLVAARTVRTLFPSALSYQLTETLAAIEALP